MWRREGALVEVKWPYKNGTTVCQNINEKKKLSEILLSTNYKKCIINTKTTNFNNFKGFQHLTPLSTIFQLYCGGH